MNLIYYLKRTVCAVLCMISMLLFSCNTPTTVYAGTDFVFVLLSDYQKTMDIGDEFYLIAVASNGKRPKFSSDNSSVASVNSYGKITAKKSGTALITAKVTNGEAWCSVTVKKTGVYLNKTNISIENGVSTSIRASSSTGHEIKWRSSKPSIATIDELGTIKAKKPGETIITATVDGSTASCAVTVKEPTLSFDQTEAVLYRGQSIQLKLTSSSKISPKWKTNKRSVATVDNKGNVKAIKNGTAIISANVDGVLTECTITVKKPIITLSASELFMTTGQKKKLSYKTDSPNAPTFSCSNTNVVQVHADGTIQAVNKGTAYVYASEDGTKVKVKVKVSNPK